MLCVRSKKKCFVTPVWFFGLRTTRGCGSILVEFCENVRWSKEDSKLKEGCCKQEDIISVQKIKFNIDLFPYIDLAPCAAWFGINENLSNKSLQFYCVDCFEDLSVFPLLKPFQIVCFILSSSILTFCQLVFFCCCRSDGWSPSYFCISHWTELSASCYFPIAYSRAMDA